MTESDLRTFLAWFKEETESKWAAWQMTLQLGIEESEGRGAAMDWQTGTCWKPLSADQINDIEHRWGLHFPWDYRIFLLELGIPDRPALIKNWIDDQRVQTKEGHRFIDWNADQHEIASRLNWPTIGLFEDSKQPYWWDMSWGDWNENNREPALYEIASNIMMVTRAAPQLIPFYSHRYLLPRGDKPSVCLSIHGRDIILYGVDLRAALLDDFSSLLPLQRPELDFPDQNEIYTELKKSTPFWDRFL